MADTGEGYTDYARARCCAITRAGTRCSGRWATALSMTLSWDPVRGIGQDMPQVVFCHRHRHWAHQPPGNNNPPRRPLAHGGWFGWLGPHFYYARVFAAPTGDQVAPWWLARALSCRSGDTERKDAA